VRYVIHQLERFIRAQDSPLCGFPAALEELRGGGKRGHWIWYIFPQLSGLGQSWNSEFYGVDGADEAIEYLKNPVLRNRLLQMTAVVADRLRDGVQLRRLMGGDTDTRKLVSSMTLFHATASRPNLPEAGSDVAELRELSRLSDDVLSRAQEQGYPPCRFTIEALRRAGR
jgi:uncharacterized protein (DUF1810 family)